MMSNLEMKVFATIRDVFVVFGNLMVQVTELSRALFLALQLTLYQLML